jgi:hypothetical protein
MEQNDAVEYHHNTNSTGAATAARGTGKSIVIREAVWQGSRISIPSCRDARRAATPIRFPDDEDANPAPKFSFSGMAAFHVSTNNPAAGAAIATASASETDKFDTEAATIIMFMQQQVTTSEDDGFKLDGEEAVISCMFAAKQPQQPTTTSRRYHDNEHMMVFPDGIYKDKQVVVGRGWNETFGYFIEVGWSREHYHMSRDFALVDRRFVEHNQPPVMKVLVARRYLKDQDERSSWSLDMLAAQIEMDLPFSPLGIGPWSRILEFVHGNYSSISDSSNSLLSPPEKHSQFEFR